MNFDKISNLVAFQFPDFYRTEGRDFVQFVKAYYEWEETRSKARELQSIADVDSTPEEFLEHFRATYMDGVPKEILGDRRLLQKHILDLYRSKGSIEGVRLIFRLLYNEEIDYYVPAQDIFKPDASVWFEPYYMEVSKFPTNSSFIEKNIVGKTSGAKAIVENYERRSVPGNLVDVLFVSNISGKFLPGEKITYEGIDVPEPTILGSVESVTVTGSNPGFAIGAEGAPVDGSGKYLKTILTGVSESSIGIINFNLVDGGKGYTYGSTISITSGSNTGGSGAAFAITDISNTFTINVSTITVNGYSNVAFNAITYGGLLASANSGSTLESALDYDAIVYGTINQIATTNPGTGYDGTVTVKITEPSILTLKIPDGNGKLMGNDAVVTTEAVFGTGIATSMKVVNSGFGYYQDGELVTISADNDTGGTSAVVRLNVGGVGRLEGFWRDSTSFTDSDKYLQDDDYYQEFSYEIILRKKISEYYEVLRQTVHPTGNKLFGKIRIVTDR